PRCPEASSISGPRATFVSGLLCVKRSPTAPAICPHCTLLVRPIFAETASEHGQLPSATPEELAAAIRECMEAGGRVLNVSSALVEPASSAQRALAEALDEALRRGVLIVAAAGNQGTLGSSVLTRHPGVIPLVAYHLRGTP